MNYKPGRKAIALEYGKNPVPVLTAIGEDVMAEAIIAEAKKQGIHITEDPQLVALLSTLELNAAICIAAMKS